MTINLEKGHYRDCAAIAGILSATTDQARAWLPRLYTGAEELGFADKMVGSGWVTVAKVVDEVLAFSARDGSDLHALYVSPQAQGYGLGKMLLDEAKASSPGQLVAWSFQANTRASAFYLREGFLEMARTNGSGNDYKLPDIRYDWREGWG